MKFSKDAISFAAADMAPDGKWATRSVQFTLAEPCSRVELGPVSPMLTAAAHLDAPLHGSIKLQPPRDLPDGTFIGQLRLIAIRKSGEAMPDSALPVTVTVARDVAPVPNVVSFGPLNVGSVSESDIELTSRSGRPVLVASVTPLDPGTAIEPDPRSVPEVPALYVVRQRAIKRGSQSAKVLFDVVCGGVKSQALLQIDYVGVDKHGATK